MQRSAVPIMGCPMGFPADAQKSLSRTLPVAQAASLDQTAVAWYLFQTLSLSKVARQFNGQTMPDSLITSCLTRTMYQMEWMWRLFHVKIISMLQERHMSSNSTKQAHMLTTAGPTVELECRGRSSCNKLFRA